MLDRTYSQVTEKVKISVIPLPLERESSTEENVYAFSYTITIENLGSETVQLVERHWLVYSADKQIAEVVGPGVVGEQPILEPGKSFEYTSGTVVNDPVGAMQGTYTFRTEQGRYFGVGIPRFDLIYPIMVH